jgi:dihydroxyacetone kinase
MKSGSIFASCKPQSQPLKLTEQGRLLELAIVAAANALIQLKDTLNEWDSKVGDGDCGSTVSPILEIVFLFII